MAYATGNLNVIASTLGGAAPRMWLYYNATPDSDATIVTAAYVSDGVAKGMKLGDIVDAVNTGTALYKRYQCTSINTTTGTATLAAPTAIT